VNAFFSPEVVGIIRNKILATIEKVLSIKFSFIRDLGIVRNPFYNLIIYRVVRNKSKKISQTKELYNTVRNNIKTDSLIDFFILRPHRGFFLFSSYFCSSNWFYGPTKIEYE